MSPELNGNPPIVTKRKKHLEKKHSSTSLINESSNMNMFGFVQQGNSSNSLGNPMYDQPPPLYPMMNYPILHEPMSLPLYGATGTYRNISSTNPFANSMHPQHLNQNLQKIPLFIDSHECKSLPIFDQSEDVLKRRFSDPGLPNDSDSSINSYESKTVQKLTQQIHGLKESNRRLTRELTELRLEMNMMKQQIHSRHYEREYEPGMLADIIREVRDAARVREDALLSRVKHMIEEKQMTVNQINHLSEKNRHNDRLVKLEDQMKLISVNNNNRLEDNIFLPTSSTTTTTMEDNSSAARQVLELERETLLLRRELQDARAKKDESDHKIMQLDKQLYGFLRGAGTNSLDKVSPDIADNTKSATVLSESHKPTVSSAQLSSSSGTSPTVTISSSVSSMAQVSHTSSPQRITLSGPVTDL